MSLQWDDDGSSNNLNEDHDEGGKRRHKKRHKKESKNDSKKNKIDQNEIVVNGVEILPMKMIAVLMMMTVDTTNAVVDKRH